MAHHCDRDGCDSWQRADTDLISDWVVLSPVRSRDDEFGMFCCLDCVMKWAAAHSEPTEQLAEL